jgi:hypothetical protein
MGNNWYSLCSESIESLSNLQQLLLDYREIANCSSPEENCDKLMQCTVNLLNYCREEKRFKQYLRHVYKLHDLHLCSTEGSTAERTQLLKGLGLLGPREGLGERYNSVQRARGSIRKEVNDYNKLSRILQTQATF